MSTTGRAFFPCTSFFGEEVTLLFHHRRLQQRYASVTGNNRRELPAKAGFVEGSNSLLHHRQ
jgi:hypothetical protein